MRNFEEKLRHLIKVFINVGQLKNLPLPSFKFWIKDLLNFLSESFLLRNMAQYLLLKQFVWLTGWSQSSYYCKITTHISPVRVDIADQATKVLLKGFIESVKSLGEFHEATRKDKEKEFR